MYKAKQSDEQFNCVHCDSWNDTPCSGILVTIVQLAAKFSAFYETRTMIITFTSACHRFLSQAAKWTQSSPFHLVSLRYILILSPIWHTFFNVFIYFPSLHVSSNQVLIIRRIELYQYIIWYMWLPGMPVRKELSSFLTGIQGSQLHRVTYTRWCIDTIRFSWWWALGCRTRVQKGNK